MTTVAREGLVAGAAALLALIFGVQIAHGGWLWPAVLGVGATLWLLERHARWSLEHLALAAALLAYLVGNRGFAQLTPPGLPLFFAEAALALGAVTVFVKLGLARHLALPRNPLNFLLVMWIAVGCLWMPDNFRHYGITAMRDFAMVYYAGFFFIAQYAASDARYRRLASQALTLSFWLIVPLYLAQLRWPEFFFGTLVVRGVPLIMHKPDLLSVYCGMATLWGWLRWTETRRPAWLVLWALNLGGMLLITTRAVFVAVAAAALLLVLLGRRGYAAGLAAGAGLGVALLLVAAAASSRPWTESKAYSLYEHAVSIADFGGERVYRSEEAGNSGDNNQFRTVWWATVWDETWAANPWLGLGFGHDLGERFIKLYHPAGADEFSARSPHNFLLTVFARTGLIGLALWLLFLIAMFQATRRANDSPGADPLAWWLMAWVVFIAACFGVVLEGPMGAVVFWIILGTAAGWPRPTDSVEPPPHSTETTTSSLAARDRAAQL